MRRLIGIPLAIGLLILAATAALAGAGGSPVGNGVGTLSPGAERAITVLEDVLSGLVEDGTINQEQSDAIVAAVQDRALEIRAEREAKREARQALRERLRGFLEDGTLSADELAQLPEDHPLRNLDEFLEDDQLTRDELRQLGGLDFRGHRHGPFWGDRGRDLPDR